MAFFFTTDLAICVICSILSLNQTKKQQKNGFELAFYSENKNNDLVAEV